MGLDAAVLKRGWHSWDDVDDADCAVPPVRLGNIFAIGHLRERARQVLPADAVLLEKVLYSGSHTGDELGAEFMPALKAELDVLRRDDDAMVQAFCRSMVTLADAALAEGTAIIF